MIQEFWNALTSSARQDVILCNLTGEKPEEHHIARNYPVTEAIYPFVGFDLSTDTPAIHGAFTGIKRSVVEFWIEVRDKHRELLVIKIGDRLEELLHRRDQAQNRQYWDISDANIINYWTRYLRRDNPRYDEKIDVWTHKVTADFKWAMRQDLSR